MIRIGVASGPYADIISFAGDLAAKEGIQFNVAEFSNYTVPNARPHRLELRRSSPLRTASVCRVRGKRCVKLAPYWIRGPSRKLDFNILMSWRHEAHVSSHMSKS